MSNRNIKVHSSVESADATTAIEMTMYDRDGTVITLAADERVVFGYAQVSGTIAGAVTIFADANDDNLVDAGEEVLLIAAAVSFPYSITGIFGNSPWEGVLGAKPHFIAGAIGAVEGSFTGRVIGDEYG